MKPCQHLCGTKPIPPVVALPAGPLVEVQHDVTDAVVDPGRPQPEGLPIIDGSAGPDGRAELPGGLAGSTPQVPRVHGFATPSGDLADG